MNFIKILRKLYLPILMASLALLVSCNENDITDKTQNHDVSLLEKIESESKGSTNLIIKESFKIDWEKRLKKDGFDIVLSNDYKLLKNNNADTYFLITSSKDKSIKTAVELIKKGNDYYWLSVFGTVTCTGCRVGCDPKKNGDNWICTKCPGQYKK